MNVFNTVEGIQSFLESIRNEKNTVGFVPTMGALHKGHLALVDRANEDTNFSVVSIFVNPTQFNQQADLENYPRTLDKDLNALYDSGCDVVFVPGVEEVYPPVLDTSLQVDLNGLDEPMEGVFRPGHFKGMGQVVIRLLNIVQPDKLFMGQKDFQQFAIVKHLLKALGLPVELVMCPTIREESGLAMSSRNQRLDPDTRLRASVIFQTLRFCADQFGVRPLAELQQTCLAKLNIPGFRPEYFEIVDGETLKPAVSSTHYVVACCAVWAGEVRLIDNMILRD